MRVKPNHPLAELLAQLLHGVETIPRKQMKSSHMRACREAAKWHKEQVDRLEWWVYDMEKWMSSSGGSCPNCNSWLRFKSHREDCDLFLLVSRIRHKMEETRKKNDENSIS